MKIYSNQFYQSLSRATLVIICTFLMSQIHGMSEPQMSQIVEKLRDRVRTLHQTLLLRKKSPLEKAINEIIFNLPREVSEEVVLREVDTSFQRHNITETALQEIAAKILFIYLNKPSNLSWCACPEAPTERRLALAINVCNYVQNTYPPSSPIVYTSLASGELLQDYLILNYLITRGYSTITINIIDHAYDEKIGIRSVLRALESFCQLMQNYSCNHVSSTNTIKPHAINIFTNSLQLLELYKPEKNHCTNIMIMVDPGKHPIEPKSIQEVNSWYFIKDNQLIGCLFRDPSGKKRGYMHYKYTQPSQFEPLRQEIKVIPAVDPYITFYELMDKILCTDGHIWLLGKGILDNFGREKISTGYPRSMHEIFFNVEKSYIPDYLFLPNIDLNAFKTENISKLEQLPYTLGTVFTSTLHDSWESLQGKSDGNKLFSLNMMVYQHKKDLIRLLWFKFLEEEDLETCNFVYTTLLAKWMRQLKLGIIEAQEICLLGGKCIEHILRFQLLKNDNTLYEQRLAQIISIILEKGFDPLLCLNKAIAED